MPDSPDAVFAWMLGKDQATVLRLLTFLTASTVTGVHGEERDHQSTDALAKAVGLDMRKWWSATATSYFDHVSKARILDVVTEAMNSTAARRYVTLKKGDAAKSVAHLLEGAGWLPACLRAKANVAGPEGQICANATCDAGDSAASA